MNKLFLLIVVVLICFRLPAQLCQGSLGDPIINITFGSGPNPGPALTTTKNLNFYSSDCPNDGNYTVRSNTSNCFSNTWHSLTSDHTGDANGYFMLINASLQKSEFYIDTVRGLCPGTTYEFAAWIMNVIQPFACMGNTIPPNLTFNIETTAGVILKTYNTGDIAASSGPEWKQNGFFFTTPAGVSNVVLRISNNSLGGCGNDLAIDDITFRPCGAQLTPSFADGTPGAIKNLCEGDNATVVLTSEVSQGYTSPYLQWQLSTNGGVDWVDVTGANSKNISRSFTSATAVGDYVYRLTVVELANNTITTCRVASSVLTVRVNSKPTPAVSSNNPVCEGASILLNASGGSQYIWKGVNGFSASGSSVTVPNAALLNAGKYYVSVTSAAGCKANDSTTVSINPRPASATTFSNATICAGSSVALGSSGGNLYEWSPPDGLSDPAIANPIAKPAVSTRYKVVVANQFSCIDSSFVSVDVIDAPKADAGPDQFILEGHSVQLQAVVTGKVATYLWSPGDHIDNVRLLQPTVNPVSTTEYTLTVVSANGCGSDVDSVKVNVYKKVIVPNAFSPNADGTNDTWNITALNTYSDYDLLVFNRYGAIVFQSKNYNNDWRGTFGGKPLPVGTYYYIIDLKQNLPKLSGPVTILR